MVTYPVLWTQRYVFGESFQIKTMRAKIVKKRIQWDCQIYFVKPGFYGRN